MKIETQKEAVVTVMQSFDVGERFYGNELKDKVVAIYPKSKKCYVDTILRQARRYCRDMFRVVDRTKSLYERV